MDSPATLESIEPAVTSVVSVGNLLTLTAGFPAHILMLSWFPGTGPLLEASDGDKS